MPIAKKSKKVKLSEATPSSVATSVLAPLGSGASSERTEDILRSPRSRAQTSARPGIQVGAVTPDDDVVMISPGRAAVSGGTPRVARHRPFPEVRPQILCCFFAPGAALMPVIISTGYRVGDNLFEGGGGGLCHASASRP